MNFLLFFVANIDVIMHNFEPKSNDIKRRYNIE